MKVKSFVVLAIASIACANSFALEITKGHIINHKEWTTGNAKAAFTVAHHSLDKLKMPKNQNDSQFVSTVIRSGIEAQTGTVGSLSTISGKHLAYIYNRSKDKQTYYYTLNVCADTELGSSQQQCAYYMDKFELEPDGTAASDIEPQLQLVFDKPGKYNISSYSSMDSAWMTTNYLRAQGDSSSTNVLTITDGAHMKG